MVIVLHHTVVAAVQFYRNPASFLQQTTPENRPPKIGESVGFDSQHFQTATLPLFEAADIQELKNAVKECVCCMFANVSNVLVYFREPGSNQVNGFGGVTDFLPKSGVAWDCYQNGSRFVGSNLEPGDPLSQKLYIANGNKEICIVCEPILDSNGKAIAVIILTLPSALLAQVLTFCDLFRLQVAACYRRILKTHATSKPKALEGNNAEGLVKLCGDLYDNDAARLQIKVLKYVKSQTNASAAFLLLVAAETQELFCQVVADKVLDEEIRFPGPESYFGPALERAEVLRYQDIPLDKRKEIEHLTGHPVQNLLCVPVKSKLTDEVMALVCVANKLSGNSFTEEDVRTILQCFQFTATVITNTIAFQNERKLKNQTQALLQVARNLFTHLEDLTMLLREIMQEARNLTKAERCSVFLIDKETDELVAKVFDGFSTDENEMIGYVSPSTLEPQAEIRLPINQGIAGQVATTGQLLNIKDAYSHALFYRGVDESTGFRTRNILSFPIKDDKGVVLGVAQLCNKKNGPHFTSFDEDIASAFAVYCCISISHSLMYQSVIDAQFRNHLANELMMYHMKCLMYQKLQLSQHRSSLANELMFYHMQISMEELLTLIATDIPPSTHFGSNFNEFPFSARGVREADTPLACLTMFEELGFIAKYRIKKDTLARFVLMVKKGYRNPPYHNWMHAFSVAHFCYLLIKNLHLHEYLKDIELFALFVSSLCHDIDHRGTNNSFQVASRSVLAALYSSEGSVMERHHFAQSMCIINTEGCNIFESLSSPDYQCILDLMREIILATDLGHHLRIVKQLEEMSEGKLPYNKKEKKCRNLLLCLLMTSSDLGDQTKSWDKTKHIAPLIYQEFFSQGDLEKSLGHKPMEMMDRERARIPDLQIGFLEHVASPVYRILSRMFPIAQCTLENVETNKLHWQRIQDKVKAKVGDDVVRVSVEELITLEREDSLTENEKR